MVGFNEKSVPEWLRCLLGEKFFEGCSVHEDAKKNEKKVFCLECSTSICCHCLPLHPPSHHLLQIRRYVYHDVLRLGDAHKLINCSSVQPYTTNSSKVVFLKQRPMSRPFRGSGNFCNTCDRSLQDPFLFCSLSCKVHHLLSSKNGIKKHIQFEESEQERERVSVLRKKRTTVTVPRPSCRPPVVPNRRKTAPRRSPLY